MLSRDVLAIPAAARRRGVVDSDVVMQRFDANGAQPGTRQTGRLPAGENESTNGGETRSPGWSPCPTTAWRCSGSGKFEAPHRARSGCSTSSTQPGTPSRTGFTAPRRAGGYVVAADNVRVGHHVIADCLRVVTGQRRGRRPRVGEFRDSVGQVRFWPIEDVAGGASLRLKERMRFPVNAEFTIVRQCSLTVVRHRHGLASRPLDTLSPDATAST